MGKQWRLPVRATKTATNIRQVEPYLTCRAFGVGNLVNAWSTFGQAPSVRQDDHDHGDGGASS
jgi:hypothetical protein